VIDMTNIRVVVMTFYSFGSIILSLGVLGTQRIELTLDSTRPLCYTQDMIDEIT
jgi:hypothetical protein